MCGACQPKTLSTSVMLATGNWSRVGPMDQPPREQLKGFYQKQQVRLQFEVELDLEASKGPGGRLQFRGRVVCPRATKGKHIFQGGTFIGDAALSIAGAQDAVSERVLMALQDAGVLSASLEARGADTWVWPGFAKEFICQFYVMRSAHTGFKFDTSRVIRSQGEMKSQTFCCRLTLPAVTANGQTFPEELFVAEAASSKAAAELAAFDMALEALQKARVILPSAFLEPPAPPQVQEAVQDADVDSSSPAKAQPENLPQVQDAAENIDVDSMSADEARQRLKAAYAKLEWVEGGAGL
jgi:hypothetical protein